MIATQKMTLASVLMALVSTPSHAFWDEMVVGMTSVTNNLIDSSENVTITSVNTTSNTMLLLSRDIGKMADRIDSMADKIGVMADRIGVMADRIVVTESMMANFAHKIVDKGHDLATLQYAHAHGVPIQAPNRLHAGYAPGYQAGNSAAYVAAYPAAYPAAYSAPYTAPHPTGSQAGYQTRYAPMPQPAYPQAAYSPNPQPQAQAAYTGAYQPAYAQPTYAQPAYAQSAVPANQAKTKRVAATKPAAPARPGSGAPLDRVMKASNTPAAPVMPAVVQADVPHTLRVSNPALNPYLNSALPVVPQVSTRCLAGMNGQNGYRSC